MSDDDLRYITGLKDVKESLKKIPNKNNSLTLVTLGKNGVVSYYKGQFINVLTFNKIRIKETTGCGDAFMAAIIYRLLKSDSLITVLSTSKLIDILNFANGAATIIGTRYGASNSMPRLSEVNKFISLYQKGRER